MKTIQQLLQNKKFLASILILLPILAITLFGTLIAPHDPLEMSGQRFAPSSSSFPLGTDEYGRCVYSRLLIGAKPSMQVAILGTLGAFTGGSLLGIIAGYTGGRIGGFIMGTVEIILCFPAILLAILVVALWGPGVKNLIIVVAILYTPHFARIANASTLKVRHMEYIENEISIGAGYFRILAGTIFPNILSPLLIQFSLTISSAILLESGLSFLGLGVKAPMPSWGQMIGDARHHLTTNLSYMLWPALFLSITILAANLMGDGLRDILDPKMKHSI